MVGGSPRRPSPGCRCTCGSSSTSPRRGSSNVSSEELADLAGVNAAKVRKDLSYLGTYGTRGVGYEVEYLIYQVRRELGLTHDWPVVIVGAGNLGQALAGYGGFGEPRLPGRRHRRHRRGQGRHGDRRRARPARRRAGRDRARPTASRSASSPRPAAAAQEAADRLVAAGVTSILNFAPVVLTAPPGVNVRKVDLAVELQILELLRAAPRGRRRGRRCRPYRPVPDGAPAPRLDAPCRSSSSGSTTARRRCRSSSG